MIVIDLTTHRNEEPALLPALPFLRNANPPPLVPTHAKDFTKACHAEVDRSGPLAGVIKEHISKGEFRGGGLYI